VALQPRDLARIMENDIAIEVE
jgi:hypothetical protein